MTQNVSAALEQFQASVGIKFQLYNSLFLSLPFFGVDRTGILLSLFNARCEEGYEHGKSPIEIIDGFFADNKPGENATAADLLFRFVQYAERQVVLFDALEDAAFTDLHDLHGAGTLKQLAANAVQNNKLEEFKEKLRNFSVRLVLTAHPTQFYPGTVLGIINDLTAAIKRNDVTEINTLLQQLGRTPFFNKLKLTPYDEATSLIWYLENVFYDAVGNILRELKSNFPGEEFDASNLVRMGFWPGGDRDGNPFVDVDTTVSVADDLHRAIMHCYYRDLRKIRRRLTFTGLDELLIPLEIRVGARGSNGNFQLLKLEEITETLSKVREIVVTKHDGLFVHLVDDLVTKVDTFGLHFASLDIRQESSAHGQVLDVIAAETDTLPDNYPTLTDSEKIAALINVASATNANHVSDPLAQDTLNTIGAIRGIQKKYTAKACERYIISQCHSALNAMEVYCLFLLAGHKAEEINVDIVPLFETIADLEKAADVMRELYELPAYREHLKRRGDHQTIMLGFSDGTKDGGYLMANWSIYKAKDTLTALAREHGISVVFFDGRGGPPARGGGKTHKFYASMGDNIASDEIQLTVQGQTVSSNFGTVASAQYNIEQLLHAGVGDHIFAAKTQTFSTSEEELLQSLADHSFRAYSELKEHPQFLEYLSNVSPLQFYAETNIGSRPTKRGTGKLTLDGLRAIPFVGAWSQLKQNVPGYYGLGTALAKMDSSINEISEMYRANSFFKTLIDNCEMAMQKSFFPLTAFLKNDSQYGEIWQKIFDEFELCRKYLSKISGKTELMEDFPVEKHSVQMRERIVIPLTTIQQYAITKLREMENGDANKELKTTYEKLIIRCSFGIINAGRNSA